MIPRRRIRKIVAKKSIKPLTIMKVDKRSNVTPRSPQVIRPQQEFHAVDTTKITIETSHLLNKIKSSIVNNEALSVTRCGDGEMHLLKNESDFLTDKWKKVHHDSICLILNRNKIKRCEIHNAHLPPERATGCKCYLTDPKAMKWLTMMKGYIIDAIKNSDYIGLNVPHKNETLYGIAPSTLKRNGIDTESLAVIDSLFPRRVEFGSFNGLKNIIKDHHIHFITSNAKAFQLSSIDNKLGNKITYTDISMDRSYKLRDKIKADISNTQANIIFFGGGGAIKDLIPWAAKEHGKIAIDVGSIMDPWSGTQSRPVYEKPEYNHVKWVNTQFDPRKQNPRIAR